MARIRSVHPGLFTDDKFMALSPCAALLLIGIWTECDDQGVFQWRPLTLKARILPAAVADVSALLQELTENGFIRSYEHSDTRYGAVRNFRKFQRPQKPTAVHPLLDGYETYVGLEPSDTTPVGRPSHSRIVALPESSRTPTVFNSQMEEGGGREGEEEKKEGRAKRASPRRIFPEGWGPTPEDRAYAEKLGLDASSQAAACRNHHIGKGNVFADHSRAYRSWCDKSAEFAKIKPSPPSEGYARVAII